MAARLVTFDAAVPSDAAQSAKRAQAAVIG
jgi:hypothetical protein